MANITSFQADILPLFTERVMPPPPPKGEGPWAQPRIEAFAKCMADGCRPQERRLTCRRVLIAVLN
jgi:hypothetical protein